MEESRGAVPDPHSVQPAKEAGMEEEQGAENPGYAEATRGEEMRGGKTHSGKVGSEKEPNEHPALEACRLGAFVLVVGALIGVGAGVLYLALEAVQSVFLGYVENPQHPGPSGVPGWRIMASLAAAGVISAIAWWLLRGRCKPVPSVAKAVVGKRMPVIATIIHVLLQIFIVGAGMSIGRETAPRELGAMMGQRFAQLSRMDSKDVRLVVAAAAGAGFAGVYDSPLAGAFFAIEMLLVDSSWRTVAVSLGTSCVSAYVAGFIKGRDAFYALPSLHLSVSFVVFALLSAPLWGAVGALFRRGNQWAGSRHARGSAILWELPIVAVVTGAVALAFPQVCGNGRAAAQQAFLTSASLPAEAAWSLAGWLVLLAALKAVLTILTIRAGASGGVITPSIAIGACLAAALGLGWSHLFPGTPVAACALLGAAAVLASSQQAPLMASCLMLELCHLSVEFAMPVGLCCVGATVVARVVLHHIAPVTELPQPHSFPRAAQSAA